MGNTIFLLVLFLGAQMAYDQYPAPVAFDEYPTLTECQAALKPLIGTGFNCIELPETAEFPDRPGWVNGPSAGVWYHLMDNEFNERARRGLWPYSQTDLYRRMMAREAN
jgi:hypothetical protein